MGKVAATVDAHHHLWKYNDRDYVWMTGEMSSLRRDFLPDDAREVMAEAGIDQAVTVQARQMVEETEWLLDLAGQHDWMRGIVGWAPLTEPGVGTVLERFAAQPRLKGVRHVLHDEVDDFYMLREDFNRGVALLKEFGLAYDILIFERHLPQTLQFVDSHPGQVFVVDHIAKPRIRERLLSPWRERIAELAKRDNVYCKVSGMATEAAWRKWTVADLRPYFDAVLEAFGAQRLMFGSDWPVLNLAGDYASWANAFSALVATLSPDERASIRGGTAREAYRL